MSTIAAGSVGFLLGGIAGDGFIEHNGVDLNDENIGPNIIIYERIGTGAADLAARTVIGNLNGHFDYTTRIWGSAFGDALSANITIDPESGIRIRHGADTVAQYSDVILLGSASANNVYITSDSLALRSGSIPMIEMNVAGNMTLAGLLSIGDNGQIVSAENRITINKYGIIVEYNESSDRFVYGGAPRIPFGGSPRIPFGGGLVPVFKFRRQLSNETYAFYQTANALSIAFSTNNGKDGFPIRWQYNNDGTMVFPYLASAPANPSDGTIALADGTGWNPGGGAGLYEYRGGWQKL